MRDEHLIESSNDGIFAYDKSFILTVCNKRLREILELENKDLLNKSLFKGIKLFNSSFEKETFSQVFSGKSTSIKNKVFFDGKDRNYIHFTLQLSPVFDENEVVIGGMGILKHIQVFTDNSNLVSNKTSEASADYFLPKIVFDLEGRPIFFNEPYRQLWDITPKVEKYVYDHYNLFRDEQLVDHIVASNLKNEIPEACLEVPLINYDTKKTTLLRALAIKQKTLSGYINPQKNKDGEISSIEVTLIDLSSELSEKMYSNFYHKFQKLTKSLPGVIYEHVTQPGGANYFRYISANCIEIFGIEAIEVQQDPKLLKNQIHQDDIVSYLQSVKRSEVNFSKWEWEGRFIVSGKEKWIRGTSRPERESAGNIVRYGILTDVSAEKRAQFNEGIAGKRLELALRGGDLGLWDCYLNTGQFVTNDRFNEIIGYSSDSLQVGGKAWLEYIHKDEQVAVYNQMIEHIKGRSDFFDIEMRVKDQKGLWHWIHTRGQVTKRGEDGWAIRVTGTIQNIDKRKLNEHTLLESERRYRDLIEHSPLAITVHSEGKIVFANEQSGVLLGVKSTQELIGREVLDFVHVDDRILAKKRMLSVYRNGTAAPIVEEKFVDANGKEVYAEVVGIPYKYDGKRAIQLIARDITEKKKTESVLKRSEQLLSQLFENVPIGIVLLDEKRRVVQINNGFENIFGYSNDEAFGKKLNSLIIPKESRGEAINLTKLITGGKVIKEVETTRKTKDGRLVPVMIYGVPVTLKEKVIAVYGIYVDVTVSKNVEGELKIRNEELDNFVYKVSHDLRAPLSSTLGLIHLAKLEGNNADLRQYIDLIEERVTQLDRFIADVLSHSKNLKQEVLYTEIDFQQIIDDSFEELSYLPGADAIKREVEIDKKPFTNDHWRVSEVLRNLISNAIKYLNPEIDEPYIKINIKIEPDKTEIYFEDNGIGIAEDLQSKVFDMFYRATEFSEGSGIGLYIVKNAIDKMDGDIKLESTPYQGTKFYISLPNK